MKLRDLQSRLGAKASKNEEFATAQGWYSLDGRKLTGKPTRRGIYIHNGKKVLY